MTMGRRVVASHMEEGALRLHALQSVRRCKAAFVRARVNGAQLTPPPAQPAAAEPAGTAAIAAPAIAAPPAAHAAVPSRWRHRAAA
jgi:hypothetical protein